jgi:hypothetical protein
MENMQAEIQISRNPSISPYVDLRDWKDWKEIASYKGYGQLGEI